MDAEEVAVIYPPEAREQGYQPSTSYAQDSAVLRRLLLVKGTTDRVIVDNSKEPGFPEEFFGWHNRFQVWEKSNQ